MRLKEIEKCIDILEHYRYDENRNMRPDIGEVLLSLHKDKIIRLQQRKNMKDNFEPPYPY